MNADRLSNEARKIVDIALREALSLGKGSIEPEHLLAAILRYGQGPTAAYLKQQRVTAGGIATFTRGYWAAINELAGSGDDDCALR